MQDPKVFVILLNWNGYEDTCRCLRSLRLSMFPVNTIVVDNNSKERDIENIAIDFPYVEFVQNNENGGFSKGNNVGIQSALSNGADYIFILNNDTVVNNDSIGELVAFMERNINVVATSPLVMYGDDPDLIWYGGGCFKWSQGGARSSRFNININSTNIENPEQVGFLSGCAVFIKSNALQKTSGFDDNFFMYVEDVDLSIRLAKLGEMYLVPSSKILHFSHSTSKKNSKKIFRNPSSHLNPNLTFYLQHVLGGYFYLLKKHKPNLLCRVGFYVYFYLRWTKKAVIYLLNRRVDAFLLVLKSLILKKQSSFQNQ